VTVKVRTAYGKKYYDPACPEAWAWLQLLRRLKAFSERDIKQLITLGVVIRVDHPTKKEVSS